MSDIKKKSGEVPKSISMEQPLKKEVPQKRFKRIKKAARIAFLWVPLSLLSILIVVIIVANLFLSAGRVESLIKKYYPSAMNGSIDLKVEKFSLFSGFVIRDIVIKNPDPFTGDFARIDKLVLDYSLPRILTGSIRFYEIGIYSPKLYLIQKRGVWNFSRLSKNPSEVIPPPEEAPSEPLKELSLPLSIDLFVKFVLSDLQVFVQADTFNTRLTGLDFTVTADVPPVKKIPLGPSAVTLIRRFDVALNPKEKLDVAFSSDDAEVDPPLVLFWNLNLLNEKGEKAFESTLKAGTYNAPVRFKRSHLGPMNMMFGYDIYLDPVKDFLKLNRLYVSFKNENLIDLGGIVEHLSKDQKIDISMYDSRINLSQLYPYYTALTGDRSMVFGGELSLFPLDITGTPNDLSVKGSLGLKAINLSMQGFQFRTPGGSVGFNLRNAGEHAEAALALSVPSFIYKLDRTWSPPNRLRLDVNADAYGSFSRVHINSVALRFGRPASAKQALGIDLAGDISLSHGTAGSIGIHQLSVNRNELQAVLPENIAKSLKSVPLEKTVTGDIDCAFSLTEKTKADVRALFRIPDYGVNDLALHADVVQDDAHKRVDINEVSVGSREFGVLASIKGMIKLAAEPISDSDIKVKISVDSSVPRKILDKTISGKVNIACAMKGDLKNGKAKGSILIENFNFADAISFTSIQSLNLNFPFEYDFALVDGKSILAVNKEAFFDNSNFGEKTNFSIASIKAKHPVRNESIEYLKDLKASMKFTDNIFAISSLKGSVFNGALSSRQILFYLADMNVRNMEYRLNLEGTNIDIGQMDRQGKTRADSGLLSLNMDLSGRGLDTSRDDWFVNGYVNIYKITDKVANRLMKGLSEEKGKSKLGMTQVVIDNFNLPSGFYFNLEGSNVYATVTLKRKLIGNLFRIKDDEVKYDRIPIREYLKTVRTEDEI